MLDLISEIIGYFWNFVNLIFHIFTFGKHAKSKIDRFFYQAAAIVLMAFLATWFFGYLVKQINS